MIILSARYFPALYYYKEYAIDSAGHKMAIVYTDTVTLCGNNKHDENYETLVDEPLEGPEDQAAANEQWAFIEDKLENSK